MIGFQLKRYTQLSNLAISNETRYLVFSFLGYGREKSRLIESSSERAIDIVKKKQLPHHTHTPG